MDKVGKSVISDLTCVWDVGVLASLNLESFPWQIVFAVVPYDGKSIICDLEWVWDVSALPFNRVSTSDLEYPPPPFVGWINHQFQI